MIELAAFSSLGFLPNIAMTASTGSVAQSGIPIRNGGDFASILNSYVGDVATAVKQGEAAAIGGVQGSLPIQTVVDRIMTAERTLQATVAIRDKLVTSYLEISRMQI